MKKIITIILTLAVTSAFANDNVVCKSSTGASLIENGGIYSIKTPTGIVPLGNLKSARNFLAKADWCFAQKSLEIGDPHFKVSEDETGMYITRVGLGFGKIRPMDATKFLTVVEALVVKNKTKKIWGIIKE